MSKYISKENLPQYKYFNNMVSQQDKANEIISSFYAATVDRKHRNDKRDILDSMRFIAQIKKTLPEFIFKIVEQQDLCRKDISVSNSKAQINNISKYVEILFGLKYMQGEPITKQEYITSEQAENFTKGQLQRMFKLDEESGVYYKEFQSVPKLLLINKELCKNYSEKIISEQEMERLQSLLTKDVHYIVNIQEDQSTLDEEPREEKVFIIGLEHKPDYTWNIVMDAMIMKENSIPVVATKINDQATIKIKWSTVILCLLDYLEELKKAEEAGRASGKDGSGESGGNTTKVIPKYVDKSSIKIFDLHKEDSEKDRELEVFYFKKKRGKLGNHAKGYEMVPHTRKGHMRTYKSGKIVYVKASVIHKDKFDSIQSAHRINK